MEKQALNTTAFGFAETDRACFGSVALLFLILNTGFTSSVSPLTFRVLKHHFEFVSMQLSFRRGTGGMAAGWESSPVLLLSSQFYLSCV